MSSTVRSALGDADDRLVEPAGASIRGREHAPIAAPFEPAAVPANGSDLLGTRLTPCRRGRGETLPQYVSLTSVAETVELVGEPPL
jgi:hypothetical protein